MLDRPKRFNVQVAASWKENEYHFKNESLASVFKEIERQFDVAVSMPEIKGRKYTGYFESHDLETALQLVCGPMGMTYSVADQLVKIKLMQINNKNK